MIDGLYIFITSSKPSHLFPLKIKQFNAKGQKTVTPRHPAIKIPAPTPSDCKITMCAFPMIFFLRTTYRGGFMIFLRGKSLYAEAQGREKNELIEILIAI